MTPAEQKQYLETKTKERAQIQAKIQQLNDDRNKYLAAQGKTQPGTNTLDAVMVTTLHEQAAKKHYEFEN